MNPGDEKKQEEKSIPFDCPFHNDAVLVHAHGSMFVLSCGCAFSLTDYPPYLTWRRNVSSKANNYDEYAEESREGWGIFLDLMSKLAERQKK